MELIEFDTFTRQLHHAGSSRRQALQLLGGALLGGVATRLGLAEDTAAKSGRKRRDGAPAHGVQTEGKRKRKRDKDRDKKRDQKRQQPDDLPHPLLPPCSPGEKLCTGYTECFAANDCCPDAVPPLCDACQNVVCENGGLVCKDRADPGCSPCQQKTCENGKWVCKPGHQEYCGYGWVWDFEICRCVCAEGFVDCGVHWDGYRWVGRCSCDTLGGLFYCNEERGICCSTRFGCDP
jgi:hypothetical protein